MGIQAAIALRDIHPRAVQQMKHLLQLRLGWAFIGALVSFVGWSFVGLDAEDLIESAARTMIVGIVGFSVAYTYFTVSKRVKATDHDWNAKDADGSYRFAKPVASTSSVSIERAAGRRCLSGTWAVVEIHRRAGGGHDSRAPRSANNFISN